MDAALFCLNSVQDKGYIVILKSYSKSLLDETVRNWRFGFSVFVLPVDNGDILVFSVYAGS